LSPPRHPHRPPRRCPVCEESLLLTGLTCEDCGTELSGSFAPCEFCSLDNADRDLLRVFLRSRGNLKEVQAHLGVSYPTARARFDDLLTRLDLQAPTPDPTLEVLDALQRGDISVDEAERRLR
jgi:hypothetical protein